MRIGIGAGTLAGGSLDLQGQVEEVLEMVHQINNGKKAIDSDRWRLLRKELR